MALKLLVHDDVTGDCDLRSLTPYPVVTSANGSVTLVTTVSGTDGQTTFDLAVAPATTDINVSNFTYDPVTKIITLTETDGTTFPINVSDLVDAGIISSITNTVTGQRIATHIDGDGTSVDIFETVTGIAANATGDIVYTDETGADTSINVCALIAGVTDNNLSIGG